MRFACRCTTRHSLHGAPAVRLLRCPEAYVVEALRFVARFFGLAVPRIYACDDVANAEVNQENDILYNPAFFGTLRRLDPTFMLILAVLAHELGHIKHDHVHKSWQDPHDQELQADREAGCFLGTYCSAAVQFEALLWQYTGEFGTERHPPAGKRIEAVREGWTQCAGRCEVPAENRGAGVGKVVGAVVVGGLFGLTVAAVAKALGL